MCRIGGPGGDASSGDRIKAQICVPQQLEAQLHRTGRQKANKTLRVL
jgi:hypothetical protein